MVILLFLAFTATCVSKNLVSRARRGGAYPCLRNKQRNRWKSENKAALPTRPRASRAYCPVAFDVCPHNSDVFFFDVSRTGCRSREIFFRTLLPLVCGNERRKKIRNKPCASGGCGASSRPSPGRCGSLGWRRLGLGACAWQIEWGCVRWEATCSCPNGYWVERSTGNCWWRRTSCGRRGTLGNWRRAIGRLGNL